MKPVVEIAMVALLTVAACLVVMEIGSRWRAHQAREAESDPRRLRIPLPTNRRPVLRRVADGVWWDEDGGGYVLSTRYLSRLQAETRVESARVLLEIAVQRAMDQDGVPSATVVLRERVAA